MLQQLQAEQDDYRSRGREGREQQSPTAPLTVEKFGLSGDGAPNPVCPHPPPRSLVTRRGSSSPVRGER